MRFIAKPWCRPAGVSVAFDLATHRGYDSDHPRVIGDGAKPALRSTALRI